MQKLCVIIPIYKEEITVNEELSIERTCDILSRRDIFFIAPFGIDENRYQHFLQKRNVRIKYFDPIFFKGICGYNKLMLNIHFYQEFSSYDYMLIAQPDAYILSGKDELDVFMSKEYQYWGAPWDPYLKIYCVDLKGIRLFGKLFKPVICKSGNGGFSLRHINSTIRLLNMKKITVKLWCNNYNEDGFFAYFGHSSELDWFNCPSEKEASHFALETNMKEILMSGQKVFAVHAWEKAFANYSELKPFIMPSD